jgi:hypothetical protein
VPAIDQGQPQEFHEFPNSTKIRATAILFAKGCKYIHWHGQNFDAYVQAHRHWHLVTAF